MLRLHRRFLREHPIEGLAKTPMKFIQEYLDNPPLCDQRKTKASTKFSTYNADYCRHFFGKPHRRPVLKSYYHFLTELFEDQKAIHVLGLSCDCGAEHSTECTAARNALKKELSSEDFLFS